MPGPVGSGHETSRIELVVMMKPHPTGSIIHVLQYRKEKVAKSALSADREGYEWRRDYSDSQRPLGAEEASGADAGSSTTNRGEIKKSYDP